MFHKIIIKMIIQDNYLTIKTGGTILGPGTIFLMLVGAFVAAFKIDNWTSFYYNIIPILLFMIVCFTCKANVQVFIFQFFTHISVRFSLRIVFFFFLRNLCLHNQNS